MHNTEMIDEYAQKLYDNIGGWQDRTLARIGRRLKRTGRLSAYDQQALKNIADITGDMKAVYADLARVTAQNIKEVRTALERFMNDNTAQYKPLYDFRQIPFVPYSENTYAQSIVHYWAKQTAGEMINLSRTKALSVTKYGLRDGRRVPVGVESLKDTYQSVIDKAVFNVTQGVGDFSSNMRDAIMDIGGSGIRVNYGSGVTRSIDSVIRQNMLYAVKEMQADYDNQVKEELGCDGFEVDFSAVCRPSHAFMEGRMFSYDGDKVIDGVRYPDGAEAFARLNDYNCHHRKTSVILGVSEPSYSAEDIAEKNRKTQEIIEYNGKEKTRYEWIQEQRKIERQIRMHKTTASMAHAAGDTQLQKGCNAKIKALRERYNGITENVGITPTPERMRVSYAKSSNLSGGKASTKPITQITGATISKIPKVEIPGYTKEETDLFRMNHQELLKVAKDNGSNEVAFVFRDGFKDRQTFIGDDKNVDLGNVISTYGHGTIVLHNHPRNGGFSYMDLRTFFECDNIKTMTIIKNNGNIEVLTKSETINSKKAKTIFGRYIRKYVKTDSTEEYDKAIINTLKSLSEKERMVKWIIKTIG